MTEAYPLLSVIIPAYNAEKTLERACRSVWEQEYPNVELVVVDDGSTDGTASLLDSLAAGREDVRAIHQANGGVSRARNAGLDAARGELITFLDADDQLTARGLVTLWETMKKTHCHIAAGSCYRVRPDGTGFETHYDDIGTGAIWRGREPMEWSLKDHPATYGVWAKLYRREAIGDTRFPEGRKIHEDSFFLFCLFCRETTMAVENCPVVRYHLTANSASRSVFSEKHLDILYFAGEKRRIVEENFPEYLPLAKNMEVKAALAVLKIQSAGCPKGYRDVTRACQQTVRDNGAWFIPALPVDRVLFWVVRLHLFPLYTLAYRLLKGRK